MFCRFDDEKALRGFYLENGLEVSDDFKSDNAFFSLAETENGSITAAATLSKRRGVMILDYIAVKKDKRHGKKATDLLFEMLSECRKRGEKEVYITTKVPEFFSRFGFTPGNPDGIDLTDECKGCLQYKNGCKSQPMRLKL